MPTYDELVLVANEYALERDERQAARVRRRAGARDAAARARSRPRRSRRCSRPTRISTPSSSAPSSKVTLPLFLPAAGKPFGYQDPEEWQAFAAWMRENKLLTKIPDAGGTFTNELCRGGTVAQL